jgi:glucose-6-phosphate 1-dehydrogenase
MTSRVIPVVLTVFGATGDLARRKLLPALFHRDFAGQLPEAAIIVGAARRAMSRDAFIALARDAIVEHVSAAQTGGPELDRFLARLQFVAIDAEGEDGWAELARVMAAYTGRVQVYYLATAPQLFGPISEKLGRHGLAGTDARGDREADRQGSRIRDPRQPGDRQGLKSVSTGSIIISARRRCRT